MAGNWVGYEAPTGGTDIVASYTPWSTDAVSKGRPIGYDLHPATTTLDYRGLMAGNSDVVTGLSMADVRTIVQQNRIGTTTIAADTTSAAANPPIQRAPAIGWSQSRTLVSGVGPTQFNANTAAVPAGGPYTIVASLYNPTAWNTTLTASPGERDRMVAAVFRPFADPEPAIFTGNENDNLMTAESIIAPHCSSITIEFAGDYTTVGSSGLAPGSPQLQDGVIDRKSVPIAAGEPSLPNGPPTGEIYWYGGLELDVARTHSRYGLRRGINSPMYWNQTYSAIDQYVGGASPQFTQFATYAAAFGYDKTRTPWPKMLRITVTLQDQRGRLYDRYVNSNGQEPQGRTFVFIVKLPE
jgi:hypothetical protein